MDLLAVQGTLKSLLQHHSPKASVLRCSAFFTVQLSHPHMTAGKNIILTRWTFVGKVMSLISAMESENLTPGEFRDLVKATQTVRIDLNQVSFIAVAGASAPLELSIDRVKRRGLRIKFLEIQLLRERAEEEGTVRGVQTPEMTQERKKPGEHREKLFQKRRG